MKLRTSLILILIVVVVLAGFFLWTRSRNVVLDGEPTSPVLVDIITPSSGSSHKAGESLSILAQAWSPNSITAMQLWEDGQMISSEDFQPQTGAANYSWDLEPTEPGVHTYFVRAGDSEGKTGQSQTLIVNISTGGLQQISASAGDTIQGISEQTGVPLDELTSLNPNLDPSQPLGDGQPVILPPSGDGSPSAGLPDDPAAPDLIIKWQFTPTSEVNNSYCYQSIGGESWQRVPDLPFSFLPGGEWLQTPYTLPAVQKFDLLLECWGWQDGSLQYLGEGQTVLDYTQAPTELIIAGQGFQANGVPEYKPLSGDLPEDVEIPAPYALREAESVPECVSHYGGNPSANEICDQLVEAFHVQYYTFVWEWSPGFCWGPCPVDHVDGYLLYELEPIEPLVTGKLVKEIPNGGEKVAAVPLPWGGKCYVVYAYLDTLTQGRQLSDAALYCGTPPEPEKLVLVPNQWLSTDGDWYILGCENYGSLPYFEPSGQQLSVGVYFVNKALECLKSGESTAAVEFDLAMVGPSVGMTMQRAILHLNPIDIAYSLGSGIDINHAPPLCATRIGQAKADWTGLSGEHFIGNANPLRSNEYYPSSASGIGSSLDQDVTSVVLDWIEDPDSNNGFIISAGLGDLHNQGTLSLGWDGGACYSLFSVELEILYFTPN